MWTFRLCLYTAMMLIGGGLSAVLGVVAYQYLMLYNETLTLLQWAILIGGSFGWTLTWPFISYVVLRDMDLLKQIYDELA